VLNGFLIED